MTDAILRAQGLSKSFGALRACDNVDLALMPGEIHALIGPNGAGKSTLIKMIAGDFVADAGKVFLQETDITSWETARRARAGMARTFQISALAMEHSVLQNVLLGVLGRRNGVFSFFRPAMGYETSVSEAFDVLERVGLQSEAERRVGDLQ